MARLTLRWSAATSCTSTGTAPSTGLTEFETAHGYGMHPVEVVALAAVTACSILFAFGVGPWAGVA